MKKEPIYSNSGDGYEEYTVNGEYHREDGPAVIKNNGYKAWYIKGLRHREDGPAREFPDGSKSYYLNNERYSEEDWKTAVIILQRPKKLKMIRKAIDNRL